LLGNDPDLRFRQERRTMEPGESLVLFTRGHLVPVELDVLESDQGRAAAVLSALDRATAEETVKAVADELTAHTCPERAVVAVRRIF
jgi:hypothetical protein